MKLCVSFGKILFSNLIKELSKTKFAEIRLDLNSYNHFQIKQIFKTNFESIVTFRKTKNIEDNFRYNSLKIATESGADYIDIDVNNDKKFIEDCKNLCYKNSCKLILSYHNYHKTPKNLNKIIDNMLEADYKKIVTLINNDNDVFHLLDLYKYHKNLIAFGLGDLGTNSRIKSLFLGAPFGYTFKKKYGQTAEGQICYEKFKEVLSLNK